MQELATRADALMMADLGARIQNFLINRNAIEVTTPEAEPHATIDACIDSIPAPQNNGADKLYLRTSPEYSMKQLIAQQDGERDIFQIGTVYRDDTPSRYHRRDFTLLEWYRIGWDYKHLMKEVEELLVALYSPQLFQASEYIRCADLFAGVGVDMHNVSATTLRERCAHYGFETCENIADAWDFLVTVVSRDFAHDRLTFVYDYPIELAQMAVVSGNIACAERFETYVGDMELVNGCSELRDLNECRRRCDEQNEHRLQMGKSRVEPTLLYDALEAGLPMCAGAALGVNRLLMLINQAETVAHT